jgi:hypothetical protein
MKSISTCDYKKFDVYPPHGCHELATHFFIFTNRMLSIQDLLCRCDTHVLHTVGHYDSFEELTLQEAIVYQIMIS